MVYVIGLLLLLSACQSLQVSPALPTEIPPAQTRNMGTVDGTRWPSQSQPTQEKPTMQMESSGSITEAEEISNQDTLTITVVYDNYPYDQRLETAWGFATLVEYREHVLLFDTGGEGSIFINNLRTLGIDPTRIQSVMLSHAHGDHTGGLDVLLGQGVRPVVYLLPSFTDSFKRHLEQITTVVESAPQQLLSDWLYTTGEIRGGIPEQALVVDTSQGLVIITGCAHPGIVRIIEQTKASFNRPVHLVLGGFHLGDWSENRIAVILADFRRLGVEKVAPCHCTGDLAIAMFEQEYGVDFVQVGVGKEIVVK